MHEPQHSRRCWSWPCHTLLLVSMCSMHMTTAAAHSVMPACRPHAH